MALSGTISKSITGRKYYIEWSATQSIANNTSTITCVHYLKNDPTYSLYVSSGNVSTCTVGSDEKEFTNPAISTSGGGTHKLGTTKHTVKHNADGTKSVTITGSYNISATLSGTWTPSIVASGTITLNQIPRTSAFSVSEKVVDMGAKVTFTIDRASTALTHKLLLTWGGETSTIASSVGASYDWTVPLSLASDLPSSSISGCIITCETYSGSTKLGQTTLGMNLRVPTSVKPSIGSVTISEEETDVKDKFGVYLQNKSRLNVKISASGAYSSTIESYSTKILGKTYSGDEFTSNTITSSGSVSIAVTVTDSRGRTATTTKTVSVTAYSPPAISAFTAQRCDASGNLDDEGQYVKISYAFSITPLDNKNSKSYSIAYKLKDAESYTTLTSGSSYSMNTTYRPTVVLSVDNSYDFLLTVMDYFDPPITYLTELSTGFTLVDYHSGGRGMSIGKVAEKEDTFEVALDAEFTKDILMRGNSYVISSPGTASEAGYVRMASITIRKANADTPIIFEFCQRTRSAPMRVYVLFKSVSTLTPTLNTITYEGDNYGAFLVQAADSVWDLYIQKSSAYDTIALTRWSTSHTMDDRIAITFPGNLVSTLPNPYYRATPAKLRSLLDHIYPVGSVYLSFVSTSPADFFGGTWTRLSDAFLQATAGDAMLGMGTGIPISYAADDSLLGIMVAAWRRTA